MKNLLGKTRLLALSVFAMLLSASDALAVEIPNPIRAKNFPQLIENISKAVTTIAIPFAVVAIIFVGFKFLVSSAKGDEKGLGDAKKMFFWVVIGTAIVVGASVLARIATNIVRTL